MFAIAIGFVGAVAGCVSLHKHSVVGFVDGAKQFNEGMTGICYDTSSLESASCVTKDKVEWLSMEKKVMDVHQKIETVGKSAVLEEFTKLSYRTKPVFAPLIQTHWQDMLRIVHSQYGKSITKTRRFDTHSTPISINLESLGLGLDIDVKTEPKVGVKKTITGIPNKSDDTFTIVGYSNGKKFQADRYYILEKNSSPNEIRDSASTQAKVWGTIALVLFAASGITGAVEFAAWRGMFDNKRR